MGNYRVISSPMSGGIQPYSQLVFGAHFCEKKTFDDLASPWWLGGIWEYAEPFCLGVQVTLAMHGEVFFVISVFFLHLFEGPFPIYLTQREIWKVVEMFFFVIENCYTIFDYLSIFTGQSILYHPNRCFPRTNMWCFIYFVRETDSKHGLNIWGEWMMITKFFRYFFWGKSNWMHLGMSIFSDHGNHVRVQWATCFYSNVVTFGTHLKRISWLVNLHLPGHVTPYWNKV